ncbi:MAG: transketolase C-terminal domain-containing protein [Candidatus Bathyarchaeia archaeon]
MEVRHLAMKPRELRSMYSGHNEALVELSDENADVVALYADFPQDVAGPHFRRRYPDRILNLGIAEANMITVAAGLAEAGKIPYTHCHSIFAVGRAYNQIRQIAFDRFNVKMILCNTGIFWPFMGGSHQVVEEIASLRAIPDLVLLSPSDAIQAKKATKAAAEYIGPVAIRLAEPKIPVIFDEDTCFRIGEAVELRDGSDLALVSTGAMLMQSLEASEFLAERGISARVINIHTIKPLDEESIKKAARDTGGIVTVEDSSIIGGLGGAVAEVLSECYPVPVRRIGVRDRFGQTGNMVELASEYALSQADIVEAAEKVVANKRR